jgi:hypothetical protein
MRALFLVCGWLRFWPATAEAIDFYGMAFKQKRPANSQVLHVSGQGLAITVALAGAIAKSFPEARTFPIQADLPQVGGVAGHGWCSHDWSMHALALMRPTHTAPHPRDVPVRAWGTAGAEARPATTGGDGDWTLENAWLEMVLSMNKLTKLCLFANGDCRSTRSGGKRRLQSLPQLTSGRAGFPPPTCPCLSCPRSWWVADQQSARARFTKRQKGLLKGRRSGERQVRSLRVHVVILPPFGPCAARRAHGPECLRASLPADDSTGDGGQPAVRHGAGQFPRWSRARVRENHVFACLSLP